MYIFREVEDRVVLKDGWTYTEPFYKLENIDTGESTWVNYNELSLMNREGKFQ